MGDRLVVSVEMEDRYVVQTDEGELWTVQLTENRVLLRIPGDDPVSFTFDVVAALALGEFLIAAATQLEQESS